MPLGISHTKHLYEYSACVSSIQKACRRNLSNDVLFYTIEQDVSGYGNGTFEDLFTYACEDCFGSLELPIQLLELYVDWKKHVKKECKNKTSTAWKESEKSRKMLVGGALSVCRTLKSRIAAMGSIVALNSEFTELENDGKISNNLKWVHNINETKGMDAELILKNFEKVFDETFTNWNDYLENGKTNEKLETVKKSEIELLQLTHCIIMMEEIEKKKVENNKQKMVRSVLEYLKKEKRDDCINFVKKYCIYSMDDTSKHQSRLLICLFHFILGKLLKMEVNNKEMRLLNILSLMEIICLGVGSLKLNVQCGILYAVRSQMLQIDDEWENIDYDEITDEESIKDSMERLYSNVVEKPDASLLSKRREMTMLDVYFDKHTHAGKGKDTRTTLKKYCKNKKIDISEWGEDELNKSHPNVIKRFKNQKEGLPTQMSHFLDEGLKLDESLVLNIDNIYMDEAYKIYMNLEEKNTTKKARTNSIYPDVYKKWVKNFEQEEEEDSDEEEDSSDEEEKVESKKRKSTPKLRIKKKTKIEMISDFELLDTELCENILECPIGQTPTSSSKKKVYITSEYVFKGPYSQTNEKDMVNIRKIQFRTNLLNTEIGLSNILIPTVVKFESDSNYYLRYIRIGSDMTDSDIKDKGENLNKHNIVKDRKCLGISLATEYFKTQEDISSKIYESISTDFIGRYILGIGDVHLNNVIVNLDSNEAFGIDLDENRQTIPTAKKSKFTELLFVKSPGKKVKELFDNYVKKNKKTLKGMVDKFKNETFEEKLKLYREKFGVDESNCPSIEEIHTRCEALLHHLK
ncbi:predicted protein [Naegleria gruberi]|uniref:Predicted protein n=1 Tax=Naegleria gruberi TaxID=5762 RepID=D2VXS5_NAEGR|nr:uncharacterized protein NAEGRDRAFT_53094 [Naegleria gruberi]EFC38389.1 predicted protein [Naegleria gruberi]|eukprot:XP_002671133.1 predicted protein [Naegleria gruberi strain NEG-M]